MSISEQPVEVSAWTPTADMVTLAGQPIPTAMDFFLPPPPAIGDIVAVYSTLSVGQQPMGTVKRSLICFGLALGIWLVLTMFLTALDKNLMITGMVIGAFAGALALALAGHHTKFMHLCSYVGKTGMVRYTLRRARGTTPKIELLEFCDAVNLFTGQTRNYYNGIYTGTTYYFRWTNANGGVLLNLSGKYSSAQGTPPAKDSFYFPLAGEITWSEYLLDALQEELEQHGSVEFLVNKRDAVRVGPGFMEFTFGGATERVVGEALKHISIGGGQFSFKTSDAKWYSSKGKFSFSYGNMANARVFLLVLNSLLGVKFN